MPVTVLRAAIVVGAGGISWEMTRQLVKNLPAMVVPRWADTRTQPIAIDDVIRYLCGVIGVEKTFGQVYEIGGADRLTYVQMLQQAAEVINGRRVPIVTVPVLTPRLSSLWIGLVTNVDSTTAGNLIDSMSTEVLQTDYAIQDIVPGEPLSYREAVERAHRRGEARALSRATRHRTRITWGMGLSGQGMKFGSVRWTTRGPVRRGSGSCGTSLRRRRDCVAGTGLRSRTAKLSTVEAARRRPTGARAPPSMLH